jgi:hypothetical protein
VRTVETGTNDVIHEINDEEEIMMKRRIALGLLVQNRHDSDNERSSLTASNVEHSNPASLYCMNDSPDVSTSLLPQHDEPDRPIHPGLEFEVVMGRSTSNDGHGSSERRDEDEHFMDRIRRFQHLLTSSLALHDEEGSLASSITRRPRLRSQDWKLFASFFGLVLTGLGNTVANKLQAIPMCVR